MHAVQMIPAAQVFPKTQEESLKIFLKRLSPNWMWFVMRTAADIMKITAAVQERSISVEKAPVTAERPAAVLLSRDNGEKINKKPIDKENKIEYSNKSCENDWQESRYIRLTLARASDLGSYFRHWLKTECFGLIFIWYRIERQIKVSVKDYVFCGWHWLSALFCSSFKNMTMEVYNY